jgi:hypothetical protein
LNLTSNEGEYNPIQMGNIYRKSTKKTMSNKVNNFIFSSQEHICDIKMCLRHIKVYGFVVYVFYGLTPLSAVFQFYRSGQFYCWWKL